MKTLLIALMIMSSFSIGFCLKGLQVQTEKVHILKQVIDERGLISVIYIQGGSEYAQDYLTETEYLKLINS